jgi:hypothetical protein
MLPGYTRQNGEYDREILKSGDFQLISITLDDGTTYDADGTKTAGGVAGVTKIPKGTLVSKLAAGTYGVVNTATGALGTTHHMRDAVVLAETILDASAMDQPVKAYWQGTFDFNDLKYSNSVNTTLTLANLRDCQRIKFLNGPTA